MSHGFEAPILRNILNSASPLDSIIVIFPALPMCSVYLFYLLPRLGTEWASQELYHIPTAVTSNLSKFLSCFLAASVSINNGVDGCKHTQAYCRRILEIALYLSKLYGSKEEKEQTNNYLSVFLRKGDQKGLLSHSWKAGIYEKTMAKHMHTCHCYTGKTRDKFYSSQLPVPCFKLWYRLFGSPNITGP